MLEDTLVTVGLRTSAPLDFKMDPIAMAVLWRFGRVGKTYLMSQLTTPLFVLQPSVQPVSDNHDQISFPLERKKIK